MKALVYADWGVMEMREVPPPELLPDEAIIRVEACGICGSELEAFQSRNPRRTPPLILGHEFCGVIVQRAEGAGGFQVGQRVVGNSVVSCGRCFSCRRGDRHLCANRTLPGMGRPGAMAELIAMPLDHLFPCPDSLDPVLGALTEPLANGVHLANLGSAYDRPRQAIIGAGTIGLMALQAAIVLKGARVLVADLNDARLEVARELGAQRLVNPAREDFVRACIDFSEADGLDICVDAIGTQGTKVQAIEALRPGGTAIWIGLHDNDLVLSSYSVTLSEKKVLGTYAARPEEFETAIRLLADQRVVAGPWLRVYPLEKGAEVFFEALNASSSEGAAKAGAQGRGEAIKFMLAAGDTGAGPGTRVQARGHGCRPG
ncbi:MAG: alcohol dehydrogenase catalytic domain-containing protein, partial [Spirochaetales bacterium]|nr:alcohol dehydrogenase catalytic domain-containing protein [Spirochaetales bacterium]